MRTCQNRWVHLLYTRTGFEFEIVTIYYMGERVFVFDIVTHRKSFYPILMLIYECRSERIIPSYLYP